MYRKLQFLVFIQNTFVIFFALKPPTQSNLAHTPFISFTDMEPIFIAFIGFAGIIIGALIAGIFSIHQVKKQKEIEEHYENKKQETQQKEKKAEELRNKMQMAQNNQARAAAYKQALFLDPYISCLQILDMSQPLEVMNIYVRVRVHQETRLKYKLDQNLLDAEAMHNPISILESSFSRIEERTDSAMNPDEAIRFYRQCVFVGDPGAGKTTLLKYLTLQSASNHLIGLPNLPIYIELNAFTNSSHESLLDFAADQWDERYGFPKAEAKTYIEENLEAGKILLLLDALDETAIGENDSQAETNYERVFNAITNIAVRYRQIFIAVTVRKAGYQKNIPLKGFTTLEVVEFHLKDMKLFIENWFTHYKSAKKASNAEDLYRKLVQNPRIQALATNPLLLSLIVLVYEAQLDLPERRSELYKHCTDTLIAEWDAKRDIRRRRAFKIEHKKQLLAEIAWHFHTRRRRYFLEEDLLTVITDFMPKVGLNGEESHHILTEIANENGLLKEYARGWHGFMHLTFQEYFTMQYITDHGKQEVLHEHYSDPWWEEVLLLYAGYTPDATSLFVKLLEPNPISGVQEDIFHSKLITAGRCVVARPTIQNFTLRDTVILNLFNLLTTTPYALMREKTTQILVNIGGKEVNTKLLKLLSDQTVNSSIRQIIANTLGKFGDQSIVPQLLQLLTDRRETAIVRRSVADALGDLGDQSIVPQLLQLLTDQRETAIVRRSVADALGDLGDQSIIPQLLQLLSDQHIYALVRQSIADTLGIISSTSIIPDLLKILINQPADNLIHQNIAEILGKIGGKSIIHELLQLLNNRQISTSVRQSLANTLGKMGETIVVPSLVKLLKDPQENALLRRCVAVALGEFDEQDIRNQLWQVLSSQRGEKDRTLSNGILIALGKLREESAVFSLIKILSEPKIDTFLRKNIITTLGDFRNSSIIPPLLKLITDTNVSLLVREDVVEIVGKLGDQTAIPDLLKLLSNQQLDSGIKRKVANAIEGIADDITTVRTLASLLPNTDVSDAVYRALWSVSRRVGVILVIRAGKTLEILKW